MRTSYLAWLVSVVAILLCPASAAPQAPQQPPLTPERVEALAAEARDLNRQGIALLDAGDTERALERFLKSRAVLASTKNTANAAICLDRLGRYDEALELYEELLVKYASGLDEEDRRNIAPAMAALRKKVGSVVVTSTVGGTVAIDGRQRGKLPLATPLRALTGKRIVRVLKVGYEAYEKAVDVVAGATVTVDAKLTPLKGVGLLVVEDAAGADLDVYIDKVRVGSTPWEGSIPPGKHLVWTRRADRGSAPEPVAVIEGQTTLVRAQARPLGPTVRVRFEPRTAVLDLEGTALGIGVWEGRLPAGTYTLTASEPGYRSRAVEVVSKEGAAPIDLSYKLAIEPDHPRWPRRGKRWVDVYGGYVGGPTLGGDAESNCPDRCDDNPAVVGLIAALRGGYRFPFALALELSAGYMRLESRFRRGLAETTPVATVRYELDDQVRVHGPFAAVGVSYEWNVGNGFSLRARANLGLLLATVTDPVDGTAATTGEPVPVNLEKRNGSATAGAPFVGPEWGVAKRFGPVDVGLSLGLDVFLVDGPAIERGRFGARTSAGNPDPAAVENAGESTLISNERAYSRFVVWTPQLSLGTTF